MSPEGWDGITVWIYIHFEGDLFNIAHWSWLMPLEPPKTIRGVHGLLKPPKVNYAPD